MKWLLMVALLKLLLFDDELNEWLTRFTNGLRAYLYTFLTWGYILSVTMAHGFEVDDGFGSGFD